MTDILAMGEGLVEFVRMPELQDGRPVYRQGFGGDTSNAVIAAARQGAKTGYVSAIGGDPLGSELMSLWKQEGVSTDLVRVKEQDPTGAYFVDPHPSGRRFSYARRGSAASNFTIDDLDQPAIKNARVLHVSAISLAISSTMRDAVFRACQIARNAGVRVSFDTNLRLNLWTLEEARKTIFELLPLADFVFPSDDEAEQLLGTGDTGEMLNHFVRFGAECVVLTRGEKGPILYTDGSAHPFEAHKVKAVDSTGAGDSFAGAWLAYYLETGDAQCATERAIKVAAGTVSGHGAVEPIPRRTDIVT